MDEWLPDRLGTVINLANTALILIRLGKEELLPTTLEFLLEVAQDIVLSNCVVDD